MWSNGFERLSAGNAYCATMFRQKSIISSTLANVNERERDGTKVEWERCADVATGETPMLYYALVFLVVALIAGVLGFGGIAGASAGIAKILFAIFIILFLVSLAMRLFRQA